MNNAKKIIDDWFHSGTKSEVLIKKAFLYLFTGWIVYQLGYALGIFLANIGF